MAQVMSEEEASKKVCPMKVHIDGVHCIGSRCMGWDWTDGEIQTKQYYAAGRVWAEYEKEQEEAGWTLVMQGTMRSHWTKPLEQPRRGFCGMVPQVFAQVEVNGG